MFCPNCGKELPEGSRFCENCGAPLPYPVNPAPVNNGSTGKKRGGTFFVVALLAVCVIAAIIFFSTREEHAKITDEEQKVLDMLYTALDEEDFETAAAVLYANDTMLYALEQEYFPGDVVTYDGKHLGHSLKKGKRLAIKVASDYWHNGGELVNTVEFDIMICFGNFKSDIPDGNFITMYINPVFYGEYFNRENVTMPGPVYIVKCSYDKGKAVGKSEVQYWTQTDSDIGNPIFTPMVLYRSFVGMLNDEKYTGEVEVTFYPVEDQKLYKRGYSSQVLLEKPVTAQVDAEESYDFGYYKNGTTALQYHFLDDTFEYYIPMNIIENLNQNKFYWSYLDGDAIVHDDDSEDILPDGSLLSEREEDSKKGSKKNSKNNSKKSSRKSSK